MECRKELVEQYRKWILHHTNSRYRISENCNGTIELQTENYIASIYFSEEEIIELRELVYSVFFMAFIFFLRQRYWH